MQNSRNASANSLALVGASSTVIVRARGKGAAALSNPSSELSIDGNGYALAKSVDWVAEEGGSVIAWVTLYYGDPRRRSKFEASFVMAPDGAISD